MKMWNKIVLEKLHNQDYAQDVIDDIGANKILTRFIRWYSDTHLSRIEIKHKTIYKLIRILMDDEDGNTYETNVVKKFFEMDKNKKLEKYN